MLIVHVFSVIYDAYLNIHCYLIFVSKILYCFGKTDNDI